ncbi:MAG: transcriptional regulator, HxlR family protein [Alphaproteobacteria bacterium]|nr:MAG: transcriptional regulator, HxlR family protein [Alphaproteobacteria bacterium]
MSNSDNKIIRHRSPIPLNQCGAALATDIISDRWTVLIIREAFYGVKRYDDIREDIQIPRSVLTTRLKRLVEAEILEREPYREAGSRTRYAYILTNKGKDLGLMLLALMQWGDKHIRNSNSAIILRDKEDGKLLKVGLIKDDTETVPIDAVSITLR